MSEALFFGFNSFTVLMSRLSWAILKLIYSCMMIPPCSELMCRRMVMDDGVDNGLIILIPCLSSLCIFLPFLGLYLVTTMLLDCLNALPTL